MSTLQGGPGSIVTDGLVLYLDAGNYLSYPGSGTTWTDLSSGGSNGTLTNGPTYSPDNAGSIVFDGVDDYAAVSCNLSTFSSLTVSIYTYIKSQANIQSRLFSNRTSSGVGLAIWVATSTLNARLNGTKITSGNVI